MEIDSLTLNLASKLVPKPVLISTHLHDEISSSGLRSLTILKLSFQVAWVATPPQSF